MAKRSATCIKIQLLQFATSRLMIMLLWEILKVDCISMTIGRWGIWKVLRNILGPFWPLRSIRRTILCSLLGLIRKLWQLSGSVKIGRSQEKSEVRVMISSLLKLSMILWFQVDWQQTFVVTRFTTQSKFSNHIKTKSASILKLWYIRWKTTFSSTSLHLLSCGKSCKPKASLSTLSVTRCLHKSLSKTLRYQKNSMIRLIWSSYRVKLIRWDGSLTKKMDWWNCSQLKIPTSLFNSFPEKICLLGSETVGRLKKFFVRPVKSMRLSARRFSCPLIWSCSKMRNLLWLQIWVIRSEFSIWRRRYCSQSTLWRKFTKWFARRVSMSSFSSMLGTESFTVATFPGKLWNKVRSWSYPMVQITFVTVGWSFTNRK